ncbi:MAG: thioredoxin family protein [Desulfobacterales bacterium]|nr:MAG: thioredoxin family protein [Desulfobacterales bacterium]
MKKVQVMGPGCAKCDEVRKRVEDLVNEHGLDVELKKVTDFQEMAAAGVFSTPAVVVDGVVKVVGRVPSKRDILQWLV